MTLVRELIALMQARLEHVKKSGNLRPGVVPDPVLVVLDGARVAEVGSHDELMARGGMYADLYGIQAAAYR